MLRTSLQRDYLQSCGRIRVLSCCTAWLTLWLVIAIFSSCCLVSAQTPCVHGQITDGVCVCDAFYSGADCSIACPGLVEEDCTDEGCYGVEPSVCGEKCQFRESDGACLGMHSCVENLCSGRGICEWGNDKDGSCTNCQEGWFGKDCGTQCSTQLCYERHGVAGLQCNPTDGTCECPNTHATGHFVSIESLCRECAEGWFGVACDLPCQCNGHGSCTQVTGDCECYDDDLRGHWAGTDCSVCSDDYLGITCTQRNVLLTQLKSVTVEASSTSLETTSSGAPSPPATFSSAAVVDTFRSAARLSMAVSTSTRYLAAARGSVAICGTVTSESSVDLVQGSTVFNGLTVWDSTVGPAGGLFLLLTNDSVVDEWHVLVARQVISTTATGETSEQQPCSYAIVSDTVLSWRDESSSSSSSSDSLPSSSSTNTSDVPSKPTSSSGSSSRSNESSGAASSSRGSSSDVASGSFSSQPPATTPAPQSPRADVDAPPSSRERVVARATAGAQAPSHYVVGASFASASLDWVLVSECGTVFHNSSDPVAVLPPEGSAELCDNGTASLEFHQRMTRVQPMSWMLEDGSVTTANTVLMAGSRSRIGEGTTSSSQWQAFYLRLMSGANASESSMATELLPDAVDSLAKYTQALDMMAINATHLVLLLVAPASSSTTSSPARGAAATIGVVVLSRDSQLGAFQVAGQLDIAVEREPNSASLAWYPAYQLLYIMAPNAGADGTAVAAVHLEYRKPTFATGMPTFTLTLTTFQYVSPNTVAETALAVVDAWSILYSASWQPAYNLLGLEAYATYSVFRIFPETVTRDGGAEVTVYGAFLPQAAMCVFDNSTAVTARWLNSSAVACATPAFLGKDMCEGDSVSVSSGRAPFRAPASTQVNVFHYPAPLINSVTATNGAYTSIHWNRPLLVRGQGFADVGQGMDCRFEDADGMDLRSAATFVTSEILFCEMPLGITRPSRGETGTVSVSYDGTVFSNKIPFTFVGEAHQLQVASPAQVVVRAASLVGLPNLVVEVADSEGHPLRELDDDEAHGGDTPGTRVVVVGPLWFNSTRKEIASQLDPFASLIVMAYTNKTREGTTSFTAYLQSPRVGVGLLQFTSAGLAPANITYTVLEGVPRRLAVTIPPPLAIDNTNSIDSRQPVISLLDDSDNVVTNRTELQNIVVVATFYNGTGRGQEAARPAVEGYVPFDHIYQRGQFGLQHRVTFSATGMTSVSTALTPIQSCLPSKYGTYGSTECRNCPPHAVCNGSYEFNVTPSFWKAGPYAYTVYPCPNPRVCNGMSCRQGYTGILCTECANDYGKTANLCVRCFSVAANIVLLILIIVAVLAVAFGIVVIVFQALSQYTDAMNILRVLTDCWQLASLLVAPLPEMPAFVERFAVVIRVFTRCDVVRLSPLSCLFHLDAHNAFLIVVVAPPIICILAQGVLFYAHRVYRRYVRRKERENRFNQSLAPFKSQEEYFARIAQLGLDEEPTISTGVSATLEDLEMQNQKIREAYALLDKNRHATATISQMPPSKPTDLSIRALYAEHDRLVEFIEQYEAAVSKVRGPRGGDVHEAGTDLSRSITSSTIHRSAPPTPASADLQRVSTPAAKAVPRHGASAYSQPLPFSLDLLQPPQQSPWNDVPTRDGAQPATKGRGSDRRTPRSTSQAVPPVSFTPGFLPVTETRFMLFGGNEPPFEPIPAHIDIDSNAHRLATAKERPAEAQGGRMPFYFQWPSRDQHFFLPPLIIIGYLYVTILYYCFSLVPCKTIDLGVTAAPSTRRVLLADTTIDCDAASHRKYRIAGITVGSIVGLGFPLLTGVYLFLGSIASGKVQQSSFHQTVELILGLHMPCVWWELVPHLLKFAFVLLFVLLPSPHLASLIAFWLLAAVLGATLWVAPYRSCATQSMACFGLVALLGILSLQMIPFAHDPYGAALDTGGTVSTVCGVFVLFAVTFMVAVFLAVVGTMLFASPAQLEKVTQSWETVVHTVTAGGLAVRYGGAVSKVTCMHLPFSFQMSNTAIVNMEALRALDMEQKLTKGAEDTSSTEKEPDLALGERAAELREAHSMRWGDEGVHGLLPSAFHAGRLATAGAMDLLLKFVKETKVQLNKRPRNVESAPSMQDMEREMQEASSIAAEHAQRLDRLIQLFNKLLERQKEHS